MPDALKAVWDKSTQFWSDRTVAQRILLAGLAATTILTFILMVFWMNKTEYKVLFSKLPPEDANRVVDMLKSAKIEFKIEDNGATVLVPVDLVYEQRLRIAGEGVLRGQGLGYEIFDGVKVGQTDFVQRINYQRALQGELARTINEFPEVDKVRVHLVLPQKSLFIEEQRKASASVVLTLKQGQKLDQKQVQGIVNFVAMSVEGLEPNRVTITDTGGKILYQGKGENTLDSMTSTQLEFKNTYESNLENRIEQMLTPIAGPGKSLVKTNAVLDFSQRTTRRESYDPEKTVIRSEQRSEESSTGSADVGGAGVPEANFRGEGFSGTASKQTTSREARTTNYEINKEEQNIVGPMGELKRLSVAVIVDGKYEKGQGQEKSVFVPRSAEELERIKQLVSKAAGLDPGRGDTIEVSSFPFGEEDRYAEPSLTQTMLEYAQRLGKPFLNGLLIFLFLVLVVRPLVMNLIRPRVTQEDIEALERLPEGEARMALAEVEESEIGIIDASKRLEMVKGLSIQLFETDADQAVGVLRNWLKQEAA
jgi:flagellar M-ring protein FliF